MKSRHTAGCSEKEAFLHEKRAALAVLPAFAIQIYNIFPPKARSVKIAVGPPASIPAGRSSLQVCGKNMFRRNMNYIGVKSGLFVKMFEFQSSFSWKS